MKRTKKVAFCGVMTALACAIMLVSYFPYLTYAVPIVAGLMTAVVVTEVSKAYALGAYFASAIIVLFFAEPEAKLLYVMFFGYYPLLKIIIEKLNKRFFEDVLKFACFNAAILSVYLLFSGIAGIDMSDMNTFGKYTGVIFLAAGNVVFFMYDRLIERLAVVYLLRIHPVVKKIFKF